MQVGSGQVWGCYCYVCVTIIFVVTTFRDVAMENPPMNWSNFLRGLNFKSDVKENDSTMGASQRSIVYYRHAARYNQHDMHIG